MFGCTNIVWNVFSLFFLHVKSIVYEVYPPYCVCNPWAHVSHLVFRPHCHVRLSVFGSAAFELIYLFPWFPPSLPCALSYFQDLKVIHPNQDGLCHQFACTRFSCLFSAVCVISLSVGCVFTWIVPSDAARSPTSSFLLRTPRRLRQGYGCFPQTLPDSARQSPKDTSAQGNMLLRLFSALWMLYTLKQQHLFEAVVLAVHVKVQPSVSVSLCQWNLWICRPSYLCFSLSVHLAVKSWHTLKYTRHYLMLCSFQGFFLLIYTVKKNTKSSSYNMKKPLKQHQKHLKWFKN